MHRTFIKALGGATNIAKWILESTGEEVDREAIYKWGANDVPWKWRPILARMAGELAIPLPDDFHSAARHSAPKTTGAAA